MCGHVEIGEQKDMKIVKRDGSAYTSKNTSGNPGSMLPVVTDALPDKVQLFRWGLLTLEDDRIHSKRKHARIESLTFVADWKELVGRKHCVARVQSYFEYNAAQNITYRVERTDDKPFYIAGLWDIWFDIRTGLLLPNFLMITVPPNTAIEAIHDRMPAILERENIRHWLHAHLSGPERVSFLKKHPCPPENLKISVHKQGE
jgi:putative SOS response-associated peptidase YedK